MQSATSFSEQLLQAAIKAEASDIHFYPRINETDIYFRIHGERKRYDTISTAMYRHLLTYYKFTSGMDIGEVRKPQSGSFRHHTSILNFSFRLSTLPLKSFESLAIRILPQEQQLHLDELFLFPYQLQQIKQSIFHKSGMILFTGPTGSGKSTTLYALLQYLISQRSFQIITLEEPIEKEIDDVLQVQVNEKAGLTYHTCLKATLRHDPDIIMIGEIRDEKTAHFALKAALTGHLVLSTLHAKNAKGTIFRLYDMGISKQDLHQTLRSIAALQLLPIKIKGKLKRRAAILEFLDETAIFNILEGRQLTNKCLQTFKDLRKKAYAYGFISKKTLFEENV